MTCMPCYTIPPVIRKLALQELKNSAFDQICHYHQQRERERAMARRRGFHHLITGFTSLLNSLLWPSFTNTFTLFFRNVQKDSDQNHETICLF
ncbi:hypothetical protein PAHAL_3G052800 [Panicum hallii]|uniref:Uncharacterized protein n=1 Tax=Panicum hallii TaxID=206008 RepID=A0A2S3H6G3_9POAL|nr:hypothetical protein PAHAL_3G052800 [Panicum hallii]